MLWATHDEVFAVSDVLQGLWMGFSALKRSLSVHSCWIFCRLWPVLYSSWQWKFAKL